MQSLGRKTRRENAKSYQKSFSGHPSRRPLSRPPQDEVVRWGAILIRRGEEARSAVSNHQGPDANQAF